MDDDDIRLDLLPVIGYTIMRKGDTLLARPFLSTGEKGEFECEVGDGDHVLGIMPALPGTFEVFAHFGSIERGYVMGFDYHGAPPVDWDERAREALERMTES